MALKVIMNLKNSNIGVSVSYATTVPINSVGINGDICILTNGSHYKKIAGVWTIQLDETMSSATVLRYVDRDALIIAAGSSANKLGVVSTEPGNMYIRNNTNTKWVVLSGNSYPTVYLPSSTDFDISTGTLVFDATNLKWVYE